MRDWIAGLLDSTVPFVRDCGETLSPAFRVRRRFSWLDFFSKLGSGVTGEGSISLWFVTGRGGGEERRGAGSSAGSARILANDIGSAALAGFWFLKALDGYCLKGDGENLTDSFGDGGCIIGEWEE
jgi:hypothetical protein